MNRSLASVLLVVVVAVASHVALVWGTPRLVMSIVIAKMNREAMSQGFDERPLATSASRKIVRPSPDIAYSTCSLDLSKGPARLTVPLTAPYTSLSLFSSATDNFFVRNDLDTGGRDIDIVVIAPGAKPPLNIPAGAEIVRAPTVKSIALVRRVVENTAAFSAIDAVRRKATCAPYSG